MMKNASRTRLTTRNVNCVLDISLVDRSVYDLTNAASYGSRNMIAKSSIIMNISQYRTYHADGRMTTLTPHTCPSGEPLAAASSPAPAPDQLPALLPVRRCFIAGSSRTCLSSSSMTAKVAFFCSLLTADGLFSEDFSVATAPRV